MQGLFGECPDENLMGHREPYVALEDNAPTQVHPVNESRYRYTKQQASAERAKMMGLLLRKPSKSSLRYLGISACCKT